MRNVPGYRDFGRIRIPPLPAFIVLTDRDDGVEWLLTHASDGDHIALSDTLPTGFQRFEVHTYGAFDGPILDTEPRVQLLVRGGRLGYEFLAATDDVDQAPIYSRRGYSRVLRQIIVPTGWTYPDALGWTELTL